ncbi:MAG: DinB family protein, partial [Anaerolineaceae bacterium]|nr:DinB family protein [Anaerolineaceae bacterium]
YLNWVTNEKLLEIVDIPIGEHPFKLARWQLLTQSLLHSAHHRGELSIVMTGLGHPLPTLDAIIAFIHESGQTWPW